MPKGNISNRTNISGSISSNIRKNASVSVGGGSTDHNRLTNRNLGDQHPISAITDLEEILEEKLDSKTALPLIEEATKGKAKGLYYDAMKELASKPYWYLTSEIDPITKQGTKSSIISGPYNLGAGGGGSGGGGITKVVLKQVNWPSTVVINNPVSLTVSWSSMIGEGSEAEPTGNGTLYLSVNNKQVEVKSNCPQGEVTFNLDKYLTTGNNVIQVRCLDAYGTTGITVGTLNTVNLEIKSSFDGSIPYTNIIPFTYIPYGDVRKTVYFYIDDALHGTQIVNSTGESQNYQISSLAHGSHKFKVYFESTINGENVRSNSLEYDLMYYVEGNQTPIISSTFKDFEQEQYINFNIPYNVFIYNKNIYNVDLYVNNIKYQSLEVDSKTQFWGYKNDVPGNYELKIVCGETEKVFNIHINKSSIEVNAVSQGLALALTTSGRSNSEPLAERIKWEDKVNNISCNLSNFNWSSNGWVNDESGNTALRLSGDARVEIPYKIFQNDFKNLGKTIELEIATSSVRDYSSTIISSLDGQNVDYYDSTTTFVDYDTRDSVFDVHLDFEKLKLLNLSLGSSVLTYTEQGWSLEGEIINLIDYGITLTEKKLTENTAETFVLVGDNIVLNYSKQAIGFYVTPQVAVFRSQQSSLSSQYKEDEHVRLSFVVENSSKDNNRIIWMYINGIASTAVQYSINDSFNQVIPTNIILGSNDVILDIYSIRVYNNALTSRQIVNNWIADTQNPALRAERYHRNDNYNADDRIVPDKLPSGTPYIFWDMNPLPQFKGDKRLGNTEYVDPLNPERSYISTNATYNVQGTSSSVYPTKNIRIKYKQDKNYPNDKFTWYSTDSGDPIKKFAVTPGGIPDNYFTYKVDFASSEGANNTELVRLYNDICKDLGVLTPPQYLNEKVRVGIDGFPIVAFHRYTTEEGIVKNDFLTKANFNNDKANEDVYGFAEGDQSWEITNNSANEAKFKLPATVENFGNAFEIRYPDEDDFNYDEEGLSKLNALTTWLSSTNTEEATNEPLPEEVTFSYTNAGRGEDGSSSTTQVTKTFTHDTKEYRLNKFKAELENWFNLEATLIYYIFTLTYLMIDSRAKNAFPTYFATRTNEPARDNNGNIIPNTFTDKGNRWFWLPYDFDTALGIDNKGKLAFDYHLEDTDMLDGANVFNGQDSVMWNNLREMYSGEIGNMYAQMRLKKLFSYENTNKIFEDHQAKWSENIFNEDSKNKYITPLRQGDNYLEMLQGSKDQQRKWWLYNRFKYMDSKYTAGETIQDFIQFRAFVEKGEIKPNITITPYADIYATVSFANSASGVKSKRAKRNEPITIENPFKLNETETDQETYIYSASQLKSIGDLSPFHPEEVKVGKAVKLQYLKLGDGNSSYSNPHLTSLELGNNALLKTLDVRNCENLTQAIDLSNCINIEEVYFSGTKIQGLTLPDGGNLKHLHLPETLTSLILKNQPLLTDLELKGSKELKKLWFENIPSTSIDSQKLISEMSINSEIRLIGIDNKFSNVVTIYKFFEQLDKMKGLDAQGNSTNIENSVQGVINIDELAYSDYITLVNTEEKYFKKYHELKLNVTNIICTVNFFNSDELYHTQNIIKGNKVNFPAPGVPTKESTQAEYYEFSHWDTLTFDDYISSCQSNETIEEDMNVEAIYNIYPQQYTVTFDTQSKIELLNENQIQVEYNNNCPEPKFKSDTIPDDVEFLGWFDQYGLRFDFEENVILDHITLYAKWNDQSSPSIILSPTSFNSFNYQLIDNMGLASYGVSTSADEPETWINIENSPSLYEGSYTVNYNELFNDENSHKLYLYVKDTSNNTYKEEITIAYIKFEKGEGVEEIELVQNNIPINSNYSIINQNLQFTYVLNEHYENEKFKFNDSTITTQNIRVENSFNILNITTSRKWYNVEFISEYGTVPENQTIEYLDKVISPEPQFIIVDSGLETQQRLLLEGWYADISLENETRWNFDTNIIENNLILYAKWIPYSKPTIITVNIKDYEESQGLTNNIAINFTQTFDYGVTVDWGDGSAYESYIHAGPVHMEHEYALEGIYDIKVIPYKGLYYLGYNEQNPVISPSYVIENVEFSWDVPYTNPYAFSGAYNLKDYKEVIVEGQLIKIPLLTDYMTKISQGTFKQCSGIKNLSIPNTVVEIESDAFNNSGISTINIPNKLTKIATRCFYACFSLKDIIIPNNITEIANEAFSLSGLEKIIISKNIQTIQDSAFSTCSSLKYVLLDTLESIKFGSSIFNNCINLTHIKHYLSNRQEDEKEGLIEYTWKTKIPDNIFSYGFQQSNIQDIELIDTITYIGDNAFYNCNKFKGNNWKLILPSSLTYIGEGAFVRNGFVKVIIPQTVTYIGYNAFNYNIALEHVYIQTRALDEEIKVMTPQKSWFIGCISNLNIYYPQIIENLSSAQTIYGSYFDVVNYETITTGDTISYENITRCNTISYDYTNFDPLSSEI